MVEHENASVDIIKQDALTGTEENVQSNTEIERPSSPSTSSAPKVLHSTSTILGEKDALCPKEYSWSVPSIDLKISRRYHITLELARNRALRAIKRARKRDSLVLYEDDK